MSVNQDNKLLPLIRKHREWQIEQINNGSKHKLDELLFINDMVSEWLKNEIKPYPKSSWIAYNYLYAYYGISFCFILAHQQKVNQHAWQYIQILLTIL